MNSFIIEKNNYLEKEVQGFYNSDFGGYEYPNNPNFLYKLKNDPHHNWKDIQLKQAEKQLSDIIIGDLLELSCLLKISPLTVCVVPRAKRDDYYHPNQLLFRENIKIILSVLSMTNDFIDGTDFIKRHTNTKTTHLRKAIEGFVNDGLSPYPGISLDTCLFSKEIFGKDILLIDDIYTKTINIDEDMIQALFTYGAKSVFFYAVGKTIRKSNSNWRDYGIY